LNGRKISHVDQPRFVLLTSSLTLVFMEGRYNQSTFFDTIKCTGEISVLATKMYKHEYEHPTDVKKLREIVSE